MENSIVTSGEAMIQEVPESEETALYEQYTINPLHAHRQNKTAIALNRLLKVNEIPYNANRSQWKTFAVFAV